DEPALMAKHLPSVPVVVDENRVRGAEYVQQHFHPDILLLDDAFQHRRLNRTMDIVLLNAGDAAQDYRLFPAGRLREQWDGLRRADLILITKSNLYTIPDSIQSRLNDLSVPHHPVTLVPKNIRPLTPAASSFDFNNLSGKSVLLCSGIGDPESFKVIAEMLKIRLRDHLVFRDHHSFDQSDLETIKTQSGKLGVDLVLTTEKDAVRLKSLIPPELPVAALQVGIELTENIKKLILNQILQ
ncbi:MAG: tetraacyldisaccharide 4'-kinase, partial [FCB group bacterium]|nr:tetraacyldisaccharide 4'-kinase [FCB group bacterium]